MKKLIWAIILGAAFVAGTALAGESLTQQNIELDANWGSSDTTDC